MGKVRVKVNSLFAYDVLQAAGDASVSLAAGHPLQAIVIVSLE